MPLPPFLSRGYVVSLLLTLLMAGQSLLTQHLSGIDVQGLILMDVAAALLLALLCNRGLLRAISLLQSLFSLFCLSYASCMGMPPTLAAVLHGSKQILGWICAGCTAISMLPPWAFCHSSLLRSGSFAATFPATGGAGRPSCRPAFCWRRNATPA